MKNPNEYQTGDQTQARLGWLLKDALNEVGRVKLRLSNGQRNALAGRRLRELHSIITLLRESEIMEFLLLCPPEFTYHLHELGAA